MSDFKFKVGYTTSKNNIPQALEQGLIDAGDLVIIKDTSDINEMVFIDSDNSIVEFSAKSISLDQIGSLFEEEGDEN